MATLLLQPSRCISPAQQHCQAAFQLLTYAPTAAAPAAAGSLQGKQAPQAGRCVRMQAADWCQLLPREQMASVAVMAAVASRAGTGATAHAPGPCWATAMTRRPA